MGINQLKPSKKSYYHQGVIDTNSVKKYIDKCRNEPIIYRSSLEYKFIQWCELNEEVESWASEPMFIEYISALDGKKHKYYPDFVVKMKNGKTFIVEVKPYSQTKISKQNPSDYDKKQYLRNYSKWKYCIEYCKSQKDCQFMIITERFFK